MQRVDRPKRQFVIRRYDETKLRNSPCSLCLFYKYLKFFLDKVFDEGREMSPKSKSQD